MSKKSQNSRSIFSRFKELPDSSRALIRSFGSYYIAVPLFSTFTSAFLWEQVESRLAVPYFYLATYFGLALGFYLSAFLLRFFSLQQLYAFGLVAQALPTLSLCFVTLSNLSSICVAGVLWGVIAGVYWAARNLLTLQLTHDSHRDYFFGTDSFLSVSASTILPIAFGFLIEYGFFMGGTIDKRTAFTILMIVLIGILSLGSRAILRATLGSVSVFVPSVLVYDAPLVWRRTRLLLFLLGSSLGGLTYVPPLLVLSNFGGQAQLGGLQSCAALLSAVLLYKLGQIISTPRHRLVGMISATSALLFSTAVLEKNASHTSVLLFVLVTGFCTPFIWNCANAIILRAIESSDPKAENHFGYICDREASLDLGRCVGALVSILIASLWSMNHCLTLMPIVACGALLMTTKQFAKLSNTLDSLSVAAPEDSNHASH